MKIIFIIIKIYWLLLALAGGKILKGVLTHLGVIRLSSVFPRSAVFAADMR